MNAHQNHASLINQHSLFLNQSIPLVLKYQPLQPSCLKG